MPTIEFNGIMMMIINNKTKTNKRPTTKTKPTGKTTEQDDDDGASKWHYALNHDSLKYYPCSSVRTY